MDPALETVRKAPNALTQLAVEFGPRVMSAALVFLLFLLMALQGVLGNVAAGLTIIFTRPFRVGEYISIAGVEGEVRAVSIFRTAIREVLAASPHVLKDPAPLVQAALLGDFAVSLSIKPWVSIKDFGGLVGEINPAVLATFRERGIEIPHPPGKSARAPAT